MIGKLNDLLALLRRRHNCYRATTLALVKEINPFLKSGQ
jgi:hypothetical protein